MSNFIYIGFTIFIVCFLIILFGMASLKKKKKFRNVIFLSLISFTLLIFLSYKLYLRFTTPIINLKGEEIVKVNVFDDYIDSGFVLVHPNKKIESLVKVDNEVDSDKIGTYDVTYSLNYHGKNISKTRKVIVEDNESPKIVLKGNSEISLSISSDYKEPGYTATDNYDKDITDKVKVSNNFKDQIGPYEITYSVEDSSGNGYTIKRKVNRVNDNNGVIYLTFDDGPSSSTSKILDTLKKENIKATFFIVNYSDAYEDVLRRIVNEGHTLALHSYTHNYKLIYASEEAYFDDLYKLRDKVKNTTGIECNIIRFPGGSSNTVSMFNKGIMTRLVRLVKEKGFHYFDWNVDSSDAWSARTSTDVYNNVMNGLYPNRSNVVLMHDFGGNSKTIEALPKIISNMKKKGYTFSKITYDTPMVVHGLNN